MDGKLATIWTVRAAASLYVLFVCLNLIGGRRSIARIIWTTALVFYLAHVIAAFDSHYSWSHAIAHEETAKQTAALFGVYWGGGIYVNYAFTFIWAVDCAWWWLNPRAYGERAQLLSGALHAFVAFMFFNGAVIFGHGHSRMVAGIAAATLGAVWIFQRIRRARRTKPL